MLHVQTVKPLDTETILAQLRTDRLVVTCENHTVVGGLHDVLRQQVRVAKGRAATPTAAIIDSQSVKTSCNGGETSQGTDAGKKIKGRKRHVATGALGLLLVAIVTAASVQDSFGDVLLRRWIVERTLGWLMQNRRLVRDYEARPQRFRTMLGDG